MHTKIPTPMVLLIFLLLLQFRWCGNASASYDSPEAVVCKRNYDFFYLVQQWQISSCNVRPCLKPTTPVFSIYGFWPSYFSRTPSCKTGTIFDPAKISDLKDDLDREWPSLEQEENEEAWKKEWENHGICSESVLTQHSFFKAALNLKRRFDLFSILADRAIFPLGKVYGLENITDAIKKATGGSPQVECSLYKHIPVLSNIFLCYDYSATAIIDCPRVRRCRHEAVLFPYELFGPF